VAMLSLYRDYPTWDTKPFESVAVAQVKDGKWQPINSYLHSVKNLTSASVLIENDRPSKVVVKKIVNPPFEDFIELPTTSFTADDLRWNNGTLIELKNTSLQQLIQMGSPEYLAKLVTRIEKAVLNLNEQAQMADSQIQQIVVNGGDPPKGLTEFSVLYNQRIAIFHAILPGLKQAASKGK